MGEQTPKPAGSEPTADEARVADETRPPESPRVDPETQVPPGEQSADCPHCGRPFRTERLRALHVGEVHRSVLTDAERAAYEDAHEAETDDLWWYHMKTIVWLGLGWAGTVLAYMIVLG